ncbi:hypothetical protein MTR_4g034630 [Medicago truncatula]|uniref:Uncharacterized protein n=1 Tax=Medicago truncatula TaxID=3880 RepID=G7JPB8_MEDTR|nr:hypothetical protein MTR_4g034630 [Medicago truncatula]
MTSSEAPTQPSTEASTPDFQRNVRVKTDIASGHCKIVKVDGKEKSQCILSGETGQVETCNKVPEEVRFKMKQNREETRLKKRRIEQETNSFIEEIGDEGQTQRVRLIRIKGQDKQNRTEQVGESQHK